MKKLFIAFAMLLCVTVLNTAYAATCNPGYYLGDDGARVLCNPNNEPCYCPGDDMRYHCPANGYGRTTDNTCVLLCSAGVKKLHVGNTVWATLFDEKRTSPAIHIRINGKMCYAGLMLGNMSGVINVQYNGIVYHTAAQE